jgi:hypothetical protein
MRSCIKAIGDVITHAREFSDRQLERVLMLNLSSVSSSCKRYCEVFRKEIKKHLRADVLDG